MEIYLLEGIGEDDTVTMDWGLPVEVEMEIH